MTNLNLLIDSPLFKTRDDFLKSLVSQFVKRRHQLKMTQEDIDSKMGNADRLCSKWECGLRTPTSFNLFCWAETLECHLSLFACQDKVEE